METIELTAHTREAVGKGGARKLRRDGKTPGILYGRHENVPVAVDSKAFELLLRHISSGNVVLDVKIPGRESEEIKALIKEVQRNPVDESIVHFDLEHISMTQRVHVEVPVRLTGTSVGVKAGGILEHLVRELEIECVAANIPREVVVDITELDRGQGIHVRDLDLTDVHVKNSPDQVIVAVVAKAKEEVEIAAEAVPAEGAAPAEGEAAPAEGATKAPGSEDSK